VLRSEAKLQTCKTAYEQANRAFTEPWPSGGVTVTPRQRGSRFQLTEGRISLARTSSRGRNGAGAPGGDEEPHTEGKVDHRQDRGGGLGEIASGRSAVPSKAAGSFSSERAVPRRQ
jgi:hypothetical protein